MFVYLLTIVIPRFELSPVYNPGVIFFFSGDVEARVTMLLSRFDT